MVKVGLIGIGFMGYSHYQIYKKHPRAKIVAIADHHPCKLEGKWGAIGGNLGDMTREQEDLTGINAYRDPLKLIDDPDVELVDICLPTDKHHDVAVAALKAGKHVFCEKPVARTSQQAANIARTAARAKGYFMVGHCIRFWPEYQVTYDMIKSGKYGPVQEIFLRRVANPPLTGDKNWFMNSKRSGGAILDLQIHDVDFLLYLCGKPKRVRAWGDKGPSKGYDIIHAAFEYPRNVHATIVAGWGYQHPFPFDMSFCIRCEKATFDYDMKCGPLRVYAGKDKPIEPRLPAGSGWDRELDYFIKCVEKKTPPTVVTASSSLESIRLVEAELESIATGKAVSFR